MKAKDPGAFDILRIQSRSWLENSPGIIDYHTHLPIDQLAANEPISNLSSFWVEPDHYKIRVLRHLGLIDEKARQSEDSQNLSEMWLRALPQTIGSPLFEWSKLELEVFFGYSLEKAIESPKKFVAEADELLATDLGRPRALLRALGVSKVATSDHPSSILVQHAQASDDSLQVAPTFRLDNILHIDQSQRFFTEVELLAIHGQRPITDFASLMQSLESSHKRFHLAGCRISDAGVFSVQASRGSAELAEIAFSRVTQGINLSIEEALNWQRCVLDGVADWSKSLGWTFQLHFGALRDINKQLYMKIGPDSGGDSIGSPNPDTLSHLLSDWAERESLPRTIVYVANPAHSAAIAALSLVFFRLGVEGLVRLGPAWWFLDSRSGIRRNLDAHSEIGVLGEFPGMVSDSRSFFSGIRHLFFRDELFNFLSDGVGRGSFSWSALHDSNLIKRILEENPASVFRGLGVDKK